MKSLVAGDLAQSAAIASAGRRTNAGAQSRLRRLFAASIFVIAASPAVTHAQSYQCTMPRAFTPPVVERNGPVRQMPATGYTMALSWSPDFCRGHEGEREHALQCSGRHGRFGFVMHGLWPEAGRDWPQWCPTKHHPTGIEVAKQLCTTPSANLIVHQWTKHGACMFKRPETYFKVANILWSSYRWPDYDRLSRKKGLTAGDIRKAFADANSGWKEDAIGVQLNDKGWLKELYLCYSLRYLPTGCDTRRFGARDDTTARIWRGL